MTLGQNIRRLRQEKGWTQAELSERTGIKISHLSTIESDATDPKVSTVYKLMHAFECTPNALLAEPREMDVQDLQLEFVFARAKELHESDKEAVVNLLDKYCLACEIATNVHRIHRPWLHAPSQKPALEDAESPVQDHPEESATVEKSHQ
jgi:transcriptional regulator with XRE-family HTH domain